jgi:hypothetical protein
LLAAPADPIFDPLWVYQGTWQVTRSETKADQKPETLVNKCALVGRYFACQQTVNRSSGGLLVIMPAGTPGHYYTQTILPEGRATGRDELEIAGDRWTFLSRRQQGGQVTQYRTIYTFSGKDRIHFERAEATEKDNWVVKGSGDERRTAADRKR